jgi:Ferritin-like domain
MEKHSTPDARSTVAAGSQASAVEDLDSTWNRLVGRRAFLRGVGVTGAAALVPAALTTTGAIAARKDALTQGDVAILRFLAAAEIIESDLWQQYNELGGVDGGNASYQAALSNLDGDMPQYIADNTDDELSHAAFLNAYLQSLGAEPVNLDAFRTLPSSKATGARQIGRLTNLRKLNVDTSWYTRYRSAQNPDLGATFPQAVTINNQPAIPLDDKDTPPGTSQPVPPDSTAASRMQAIANTAGFHFAYIEQGGASLYTSLSLKVSSLEVLRIVVSIGGVEVDHFGLWHDKAGNAVAQPLAGVTDPETGVNFPDLNASPFGGEQFQTNLILPEPASFIRSDLPPVSVIRPSLTENAGAVATIKSFTADLLFEGQTPKFFKTVMALARAADAAQREVR